MITLLITMLMTNLITNLITKYFMPKNSHDDREIRHRINLWFK
jgi:hypothetical protein